MNKLAANSLKLLDVSNLIRLRRFAEFSLNLFIFRNVVALLQRPQSAGILRQRQGDGKQSDGKAVICEWTEGVFFKKFHQKSDREIA